MPERASQRGLLWSRSWGGLILLLFVGCQSQGDARELEPSISAYRDRMLVQHTAQAPETKPAEPTARPVPWQGELPERAALVARPEELPQPPPAAVLAEIPDPEDAPRVFEARLQALRDMPKPDERVIANYQEVVPRAIAELRAVERPAKVRLGLAEAVQRALEHNYAIRFEAYNPAISRTQLVEAEAAFDAEFFLDTSWNKVDQQTIDPRSPIETDTRSYSGGFRQLLPTGMRVQTALGQQRSWTGAPQQFKHINPLYNSTFDVTFTQPLLRGFGLDLNRAQINISRAEVNIAYERFSQQVRDNLLNVEIAYWRLVEARRRSAIIAETSAQNWATFQALWRRREHDVTLVELANAESRWRTREVQYLEAIRNIKDAEDQLKSLLNDPDLLLSQDLEIIPTEIPFMAALALDQLAAVRTALDERSEIREARQRIEEARINTSVAKNGTLPRLDLSFRYEVQGLAHTADDSFDHLTTNRYISYAVTAAFSVPIGNRGPRAAWRRAGLQEAQTVVALYRVMEGIVQEVNTAVRGLGVRYSQIPPQLEAVRAADAQLRAYQARTQRIDPLYLENELNAVERLAGERTTLLQVIVEYNIARIALEKAKGTLLDFNNVVVTDEPPDL